MQSTGLVVPPVADPSVVSEVAVVLVGLVAPVVPPVALSLMLPPSVPVMLAEPSVGAVGPPVGAVVVPWVPADSVAESVAESVTLPVGSEPPHASGTMRNRR